MTSGGPTTTAAETPPDAGEAAARLCPGCGYDLRAATTDRCSECGLVLDRAALQESGFPWAHRKRIGRIRAFARTVWQVTWDRQSLRHELAKPQDARDAVLFRRRHALAVAVALVTFVGMFVATVGVDELFVRPNVNFVPTSHPGHVQDLAVPWSAGMTLLPMPLLCLGALAFHLTGVPRAVFRLGRFPAEHQARARTVAGYAAAPLAWLLPAAVLVVIAHAMRTAELWQHATGPLWAVMVLVVLSVPGLILLAVGMTVLRTGQWAARAAHAGAGTVAVAALETFGRMLVGTVVLLGVVPWCVGFLWIVVDSFR